MKDNYRLVILIILVLGLTLTWLVRQWKNKKLMKELDQKFQEGLYGRPDPVSLGQNLKRIQQSRVKIERRVSASANKPKP